MYTDPKLPSEPTGAPSAPTELTIAFEKPVLIGQSLKWVNSFGVQFEARLINRQKTDKCTIETFDFYVGGRLTVTQKLWLCGVPHNGFKALCDEVSNRVFDSLQIWEHIEGKLGVKSGLVVYDGLVVAEIFSAIFGVTGSWIAPEEQLPFYRYRHLVKETIWEVDLSHLKNSMMISPYVSNFLNNWLA